MASTNIYIVLTVLAAAVCLLGPGVHAVDYPDVEGIYNITFGAKGPKDERLHKFDFQMITAESEGRVSQDYCYPDEKPNDQVRITQYTMEAVNKTGLVYLNKEKRSDRARYHTMYGSYAAASSQYRWPPQELSPHEPHHPLYTIPSIVTSVMNFPGHRYLGPGNPVSNGSPVDEDDRIALQHDLRYQRAHSDNDIRQADIQAISDFSSDFRRNYNWHSAVGSLGLGIKYGVESLTGVIYPTKYNDGDDADLPPSTVQPGPGAVEMSTILLAIVIWCNWFIEILTKTHH